MKEKTKILLITNKTDLTTDFVVKKLSEQGAPFYRLNTEEIGKSVDILLDFEKNRFIILDTTRKIRIDLHKIKSVYFRRPEIPIPDKDLTTGEKQFFKSEFLFMLEGIYRVLGKAYWLNNVYDIRNSENKLYQLMLARKIGFRIPKSIVTNIPETAYEFYTANEEKCIIKPIKSGLIEGAAEEGVIFTSKLNLNTDNLQRISASPVYLQHLIEKKGDIRVTIVGKSIFAALIHSQEAEVSKIDWRKSKDPLHHSLLKLPPQIARQCLKLLRNLNLNFAAIDFILEKNNGYTFLEVNPNGQWAWIEHRLNYPISNKISNLLIEKSYS